MKAFGLAVALVGVAVPPEAIAQAFDTARLEVQNDYFNFWRSPKQRPDYEFTHGATLNLGWRGGFFLRGYDCSDRRPTPCARSEFTLGQEIYTPRIDGAEPVPGERPYGGWLYLRLREEVSSSASSHRFGVTVGVTGEPSLARVVQATFHKFAGFRTPEGWNHQIPFEPGLIMDYDYRRVLFRASVGENDVLMLHPRLEAHLGTVRTSAGLELGVRMGWGVEAPWRSLRVTGSKVRIYLTGSIGGELVARDLFLDGGTFSDTVGVDRRVAVARYGLGVTLRIRRVRVRYHITARSRSYGTEPGGHTYSGLSVAIEM